MPLELLSTALFSILFDPLARLLIKNTARRAIIIAGTHIPAIPYLAMVVGTIRAVNDPITTCEATL